MPPRPMGGGSRSSRTACTCGEVPKSRSTQSSSARCRGTGKWGLALQQATARKHRTYPELLGAGWVRCLLVVLGMEVGGRISSGASAFLRRLARARAKPRAPWAAEATRCSLQRRWMALASFASLRTHASTLLELPAVPLDS